MSISTPSIQSIVKSAGGTTVVGDACGGITRQAVEQWKKVPANHVLTVEALSSKYTRYQIRPDIFGTAPISSVGGAA